MSYWRRRRDSNHGAAVEAITRLGYFVLDVSRSREIGFDLLLAKDGRLIPVEVKDGSKPPSARELTPYEQEVHAALAMKGITVEIITGIDASLDVLRDHNTNSYRGGPVERIAEMDA